MPLLADVTPLRVSADYRRLWAGLTVSQLGQQMTVVAVAIQVYDLTRSSFAVGLVGLCSLVPLVVFGLYGGAIADASDRRKVGLITSTGLWLLSMVLLLNAVLGFSAVWLIYVVVAAQAGFFAVNSPARTAIIPRLLPPTLLPSANALSTASFNLGLTVGPLLGGLLIGWLGLGAAYGVDVVTFTAALYAMWRLPPIAPEGDVRRAGLRSVLEGLGYLRTRPNVLMTFLVDLCAMVLAQPRALFPAIAAHVFDSGAKVVGVLQAAPAIGALLAALTSGWVGRVRRQGLVTMWAVVCWGASVAAFGLSRALWLAVFFLALAGAADTISSVFRNTILQTATPDAMRGRLQGVFIVVVAGGPRMGDFVMGTLSTAVVETSAVVLGGALCILAVGVLSRRFPRFARYDARDPQP